MSQDRPFGLSRNPFITGLSNNMFLDAETAERDVRSRASSQSFEFKPFDIGEPKSIPEAAPEPVSQPTQPRRSATAGAFEFQPFGVELDAPAPAPAPAAQRSPEDYGFQPVDALKKGFKGLGLTWDFLANRLEKAVTGRETDTAPILAKSVEEYDQLASDPRIGQMVREADQTYDERGLLPAAGAMLGWMVRNPTMVANFITEQIPGAVVGGGVGGVASAPLRSAAVGAAARAGAGKAVQAAVGTGVTGASINTSAVVFQSLGTNYTEGLEKFEGDTEAASDYAVTKTLAEVPANAVAGAFLGINPFKNRVANILNQTNIQGLGGAAGAASASLAVGEKPSFGEIALEYLGEGLTAPGELAAVGVDRIRERRQEQGVNAPPSPISERNATAEADPADAARQTAVRIVGDMVNSPEGVSFFAAAYQNSDEETRQKIESAMARGDRLEQFQQAINDVNQVESGNRLMASDPQFSQDVLTSLDAFISTPPPAGVYKATPPSLARATTEEALAQDEAFVASQDEAIARDREARAFEDEQRFGAPADSQATGTDVDQSVSSGPQQLPTVGSILSQQTDGTQTSEAQQTAQEGGAQQQVADATAAADSAAQAGVPDQVGLGSTEIRFTSDPGDGSLWTPEATMSSGAFTFTRTGDRVIAEFPGAPVQTGGTLAINGVADLGSRLVLGASSDTRPNVSVSVEPGFLEIQDRDSMRFTRLERGNPQNEAVVRGSLGDAAVDAWMAASPDFAIKAVTDTLFKGNVGTALDAGMGRVNAAFSNRYTGRDQSAAPQDPFSQLETSLASRGAETGSIKRVKNPAHLNKIAKLFGVELFAYNYNGTNSKMKSLAGTRIQGANGRSIIGINLTQSPKASLFVLGHEVFHDLAARFPQQSQALSLEIKAYLQANRYREYQKYYESKGQEGKTDEEIAADVLGVLFTDKKFWEQLGVRNQPLLARVLAVIDNLIASFRANAESSRMQIKEFITEYDKVRDMVASFVTETQQGQPAQTQTDATPDEMADLPIDRVRQLLSEKKVSDAARVFRENNLKAQGFDFTQLVRESGSGRVIGRSVVKSPTAEAQATSSPASDVPSIRTKDSTQPAATAPTVDPGSVNRVRQAQERLNVANMPGRTTVVEEEEQAPEPVRSRRKQEPRREPTAENVIRSRVRRLMTAAEIGEQGRADIDRMKSADLEDRANTGPQSVDDLNDPGRFADTLFEREDDAEGRSEGESARTKRLSDERIAAERRLLRRRASEVAENPDVMMGELLNIKSEAEQAGLSAETIADIFDTPIAQIKALADGLLSEVKSEEQLSDVTDETNVEQQPAEAGDPVTSIAAARNAVQTIKEGLSGGKMTVDQIVRVLQLARKDANFSIGELVYVMEQEGIEIPSVFDRLNGRPFMTPFVDYVSSSPNHPLARQQWFASLDRALNQASTQERNFINGTLLTAVERDLYADWKAKRDRKPVDTDSKDVREVFPNSLFTKFSLTQMRDPESISTTAMPLSVRSGIVDFVQDWYSDVSNALTYRPDMARQILGSLAPQDLKAFTAWRKAQQRATKKKAEVIARSVDYGNLMGLRFIGPVLTGAYREQLSLADQFMAQEAMAWATRIDELIERVNQDKSLSADQRKEAIRNITFQELQRIHKTIRARARKLSDTSTKDDSFENWVADMNERMSSPVQQEGRTEEGGFVVADEQASEDSFDDMAARLGDALFRIGNGETGTVASTILVQSQVSELMGTFKSAANVKVVGNPSHLPDGVRERLMKRLTNGYVPKGLYDAQTGNIYMFSEAATSEYDVQFTLFHELYGHFGLRAFLGDSYAEYFNSLYRGNKAVREAADRQKEGRNISNAVAVEEALSDMAGEGKYAGVIKGVVGKLIKSLRDGGFESVANWLSKYTNAEVMYVLRAARNAARNGGSPVLNGAPADVLLSEVRMPYEIYATKDGKTGAYARYNPVTMQWYVFTPKQGSSTIEKDYATTVMPHDQFDAVLSEMKRHGKVMRRLRSGLFVDNRIPNDNVVLQDPNDLGWFKKAMYRAAILAQNEYLPVFKIVEQLEKMGRMADFMNPMKALKLMERRTAARLETEVEQKYVEPIIALLKEGGAKGMTYDIVNDFLLARFAPLRNAQIAKINPGMKDGGSGMSTKEARDKMAQYSQSAYSTELNAIARLLDKMSNDKIDGQVRDGMITVEDALKMKAAYPFGYVNLSGVSKENNKFDEDVDPLALAGGRRLNLRGKEKRAMGRGEGNVPTDILARTIAGYEAAVIRGEKNRVAQTVLAMVESNPDPSFAMVNTQAFERKIGENGMVVYEQDPRYITRPDVFVVKVRGIPVTIEFMHMGKGSVANALHGAINPAGAHPVIEFLRLFNNKIGQLITTYNPAWAGVNFVRDVQTMYFNAASDGRITKEMARTMLRDLPKAIRTAIHVAGWNVQPDPAWLEAFNEMKREGGLTGFSMRDPLENKVKEIELALRGKDKNFLATIGDFMERLTLPMEMATRLAAYKTVRDNGFTRTDAAVFSGEITVDFNARGAAQELRAAYLFFNPAIQGTAKMYQLMKNNPKQVAKYAFALAGLGAVTNLIARALGGVGDDGEDKLDQLPTFKRATSIVLYPDMPMGAIPIAYGWNAFFAVGHFGVDWILGKQTLSETAKRIGVTAVEAFLPAGSSGLESETLVGKIVKGATPTFGQAPLEWIMNENRYGAPIRMSGGMFGGPDRPESESAFRSVNPISRSIARAANAATGDGLTSGTRYMPGVLDFNPAAIDHFMAAYLPGLATEAYKGAGLFVRVARGEEIARTPLPLIDRFSAYPPEGFDAGAFRRVARFVNTRWTAYTDTESAAEAAAIQAKYPDLGRAKEIVAGTERLARELNSEIRFLDNTNQLPEAERVRLTNERREALKKIYGDSIKELSKLGGEYREQIRAN